MTTPPEPSDGIWMWTDRAGYPYTAYIHYSGPDDVTRAPDDCWYSLDQRVHNSDIGLTWPQVIAETTGLYGPIRLTPTNPNRTHGHDTEATTR